MSKVIKLTQEHIQECAKEFEEKLKNGKFPDGRISFTKTLGTISRKATLYFTEMAWLKMQTLIKEFEKEVAWHGVAKRGDDPKKDEYYITDILVYPQEVSGASVEMDVSEYDKWIRDNYDDNRFFHIAMQGHSHVNMGTSPSSVDLAHQEVILNQLTDNMFYIFVIWNKQGDKNIKIYDLAKNVLFETADVDVKIINDFLGEAKRMVRERVYTYTGITGTTSGKTFTAPKNEEEKKVGKKKGKRKGSKKKDADKGIYGYPYDDFYRHINY